MYIIIIATTDYDKMSDSMLYADGNGPVLDSTVGFVVRATFPAYNCYILPVYNMTDPMHSRGYVIKPA